MLGKTVVKIDTLTFNEGCHPIIFRWSVICAANVEAAVLFFLFPFHWIAQGNALCGGGAANGPQMKANRESEMAKFFFYHSPVSLYKFIKPLDWPVYI